MTDDEVMVTISFKRNFNGTVDKRVDFKGAGFMMFELIGLLQMTCYELTTESVKISDELPKDKKARLAYKERHRNKR